MPKSLSTGVRSPRLLLNLFMIATVCSVCLVRVPSAIAQESPVTIVAVEEDWELTIGKPDSNSTGPQVTSTFSPIGDVGSLHATLEINHQSLPAFVAGGIQLQLWNDEWHLGSPKFPNPTVMQQDSETVRWTQSMRLDNGQLIFEIINGQSTTWDTFGGQGYLRSAITTDMENLNGYDPTVSVNNSGVGYAANRVQLLVLKRVRVITSAGDVLQNDTETVVHQHD